MSAALAQARAVADAVLYEGYLLYPYRSSARKNQVRWQFGVLGPPWAAEAGIGEDPALTTQCLVVPRSDGAAVDVRLRFLQLQVRAVEQRVADGWRPVDELRVGEERHLAWDEAVEHEVGLGTSALRTVTASPVDVPVDVPGAADAEELRESDGVVGRLVRRRWPLSAAARVAAVPDGDALRLSVEVRNTSAPGVADLAAPKDAAVRRSFLGAHLLLVAHDAEFLSLTDPPAAVRAAAGRCRQHRCWPVLAGPAGTSDVLLASPIILEDHPAVAPESAGQLFDSTEIDEILTLRVLTLTEEEKAEARATDVRAAAIIDRCEAMSPAELQRLHGALRDPHGADAGREPAFDTAFDTAFHSEGAPWWDPAVDAAVDPRSDAVLVGSTPVLRGSVVRLRPLRRADAQDIFYTGQQARVTAVHRDVDGQTHVAVVLVDDPAADLHDWYGRYLYFAPEELELVEPQGREEDP